MTNHDKAKALALLIFSHKYFVPHKRLTNVYDPLGWSTADMFDPMNDNMDVVWAIMQEGLYANDDMETQSSIADSYHEMMETTFEYVKSESLNLEIMYRGPYEDANSQLGWITDDTMADMEHRRKFIARVLMDLEDDRGAVTRSKKRKPFHHISDD